MSQFDLSLKLKSGLSLHGANPIRGIDSAAGLPDLSSGGACFERRSRDRR